jgi:hypothetical protein
LGLWAKVCSKLGFIAVEIVNVYTKHEGMMLVEIDLLGNSMWAQLLVESEVEVAPKFIKIKYTWYSTHNSQTNDYMG